MRILLLITIAFLAGCVTPGGADYNQRTYVRNDHKRTYEPVGSKEYKFENKYIQITYEPDITDAGISFAFMNKSKDMIKIIWDESVFINEDGSPKRVFHSGVTIKDRDKSQVPTIIPAGLTHTDILIPVDSPSFYSSQYGAGWQYKPLCGYVESGFVWKFHDDSCMNRPLKYQISLERNGKKEVVEVGFKYTSKVPIKQEPKKTASNK